ncbi:MAG: T9SS type A sorting domain-containing protein, partial [Bacteroidales bacterium]
LSPGETDVPPGERYLDVADTLKMFMPAYDGGKKIMRYLDSINNYYDVASNLGTEFPDAVKSEFWGQVDYVGMPLAKKGKEWLSCDYRLKIRINRPYEDGIVPGLENEATKKDDMLNYNNQLPAYQFTTEGVVPESFNEKKFQSDLDKIRVVPNPYYGYSTYERNPLDNRVKITNLPNQCTVTIYSSKGTMVRQFEKDTDGVTSIDWDLKNFANVPISGGVYLIHIKSNHGQRIIKWFGVLRKVDLNKI